MASFSMENFVGNGSLKGLLPKLLEEGWDDVPTLKIMNSEDMEAMNMSRQQKEALEIRSYLHDRALIQYGDKLESSGKCLPELHGLNSKDLSAQFGMKRDHIARFVDRDIRCREDPLPPSCALPPPRRSKTTPFWRYNNGGLNKIELRPVNSSKMQRTTSTSSTSSSTTYDHVPVEKSIFHFAINEGHILKGIVAGAPAESRAWCCVQPPRIIDSVSPYSAIQNITIQKLTPEYKIGVEHLVKTKTPPPMKASQLWRDKPAVILCLRRPECVLCRAQAHQLYARKQIFDALGVQLFAVFHEHREAEVKHFWPRYWGGVVLFDKGMEFCKALGGGELFKDTFISNFLLNPRAIANYKRAKAMGLVSNFKRGGQTKGGLFVVGRGKSGIAYQFIERNFGDWAPLSEVIEICALLQQNQQQQGDGGWSSRKSQKYESSMVMEQLFLTDQ